MRVSPREGSIKGSLRASTATALRAVCLCAEQRGEQALAATGPFARFPHARRCLERGRRAATMPPDKVAALTLSHAENPAQTSRPPVTGAAGSSAPARSCWSSFLLVLWQVLTRAFEVPKFLLPAPTDVARADGRRVAADPDAQPRHHRQHRERICRRGAVRAGDLGADDPLSAGRAADHADLRRAAERAEDRDRAADPGLGRRRHRLEDRWSSPRSRSFRS